ncbi:MULTISPECIES: hypothetical protein [unclassified Streptomyces]|uniref:hypothetical protein n=1 Tax=unclassified Streptomyces TaxID=2593676 RepID=UPI00382F1A33
MLERDRRKNQPEVKVAFALPTHAPHRPGQVTAGPGDRQPGPHEVTHRPGDLGAVTDQSSRYLAAGDYWFDGGSTAAHPNGANRLTT